MYVDNDGYVQQSKVVIVWGAPASGKTTYVRQHRQRGDLVVDLDLIKQSISMESKTEVPLSLLPVAMKIRDTLINEIAIDNVNAKTIWIITCEQDLRKLQELRRKTHAELYECICSEKECYRRALDDDERKDKDYQMKIIKRWFEKRAGAGW